VKLVTHDTDEETDHTFASIVYFYVALKSYVWTLDTSAIDHMTPVANRLTNLTSQDDKSHIKLPNGTIAAISKNVNMKLSYGLVLTDVLVFHDFHFDLQFVAKLAKDNCVVSFHPEFCII